MQNPFTKIHWIYINLEHRKDRKEQVRYELLQFIPEENIHRIDAVKEEKGFIGCTKSHIKALEYAKQFDISCILEDDFIWIGKERVWNILNQLFTKQYDVYLGVTGCTHIKLGNELIHRVKNSGCSSCYILKKEYIDTLINCFKDSIDKNIALDQNWKLLQEKDKWYATSPSFSSQSEGFSDIDNSYQNQKHLFTILN